MFITRKGNEMKKLIVSVFALVAILTIASNGYCEIKYVNSYYRSNGTYVSGCFKDTSHDGNQYNNANYLGLNGR